MLFYIVFDEMETDEKGFLFTKIIPLTRFYIKKYLKLKIPSLQCYRIYKMSHKLLTILHLVKTIQ